MIFAQTIRTFRSPALLAHPSASGTAGVDRASYGGRWLALCGAALGLVAGASPIRFTADCQGADAAATSYASLQEAIDANPGVMVHVPSGTHRISAPLRITTSGSGLYGYGVIVQTDPGADIVAIEGANDVRIESLELVRGASQERNKANGIRCEGCRNVQIRGVTIRDNKSQGAGIRFSRCDECVIQDCRILNYKCIGIDDRTHNELLGYAFHCIDGHGIHVKNSTATIIRNNRVIEDDLLPTRTVRDAHHLGELTDGVHPTRLGELGKRAVQGERVNNWHQGSAIAVTSPAETRHTTITGNYLRNAAQGVDMHCDFTVCSDNVIDKAMIGLKATHGARNLALNGNLITGVDLWGILLNPGAASYGATPAEGDRPAKGPNIDGGVVVSNNVISDFGRGNEYWNWGGAQSDGGSSYGIAILEPQLATNPHLRDVLVANNMVYDAERDELADSSGVRPPKYRYAVYVEQGNPLPVGIKFSGNLFHPGIEGVANIEIDD